jgi:Mycothiol maleylpyruvate isomerase N-terminal domain
MATDASYVEENARALARMRAIVQRLDDADLARRVNDDWTVAGVLAHTAFWDARIQAMVRKLRRGEPFTADDEEPEDVWWINDAARPFLLAIAPREAARLALDIAAETDALVAELPPEQLHPLDPVSLINPFRAWHRTEHLDEIEVVIGSSG